MTRVRRSRTSFRTAGSSGSMADATESGRKSVAGVSNVQTPRKRRMTLGDTNPELSCGTVLAVSLRYDEGRLRVVREGGEAGDLGERATV